jgi:hypothetical protein
VNAENGRLTQSICRSFRADQLLTIPGVPLRSTLGCRSFRIWNGPKSNGDAYRVNGGIEKKLAENLWIVLSVGESFGGGREDELFALGSLRLLLSFKKNLP